MRYLLAPVVLVALLFAAPAYAETIVMDCPSRSDFKEIFKYEGTKSHLSGSPRLYLRAAGRDGLNRWRRIKGAVVGNNSAVMKWSFETEFGSRSSPPPKPIDSWEIVTHHVKRIIDFDLLKHWRLDYESKTDGSPLFPGEEGYERERPRIWEASCEKVDEGWADREQESGPQYKLLDPKKR